jgi:hypothetical protein
VEPEKRHHRRSPPLLAILAVGGIIACCIAFGFWRSFDIALHEGRVGGTVTGTGGHGAILYQYAVDGHQYSGQSTGQAKDGAVEVRYSRAHPWRSTLEDPLLFPKQVACAATIVGGTLIWVYVARKLRRRAA